MTNLTTKFFSPAHDAAFDNWRDQILRVAGHLPVAEVAIFATETGFAGRVVLEDGRALFGDDLSGLRDDVRNAARALVAEMHARLSR